MHKWEMPIKPVLADLMRYDHVTICSPIWVFSLAAPVRAFCKQAAGKIKSADYVLVHYQKSKYENAAKEMDSLLGIKHTRFCIFIIAIKTVPFSFKSFTFNCQQTSQKFWFYLCNTSVTALEPVCLVRLCSIFRVQTS